MKTKTTFLILFLIVYVNSSQSQNFITEWTFPETSSQIKFKALTVDGPVNYTWSASPSGHSGSGNFIKVSGGIVGLTDLTIAAGDIVTLSMSPTNLRRFYMDIDTSQILTNVVQWGSVPWSSMEDAFRNCQNLQISATDTPNLAGVTSLFAMFQGCYSLNGPSNINDWNIANVSTTKHMFYYAYVFNQDIGNWNTSAITDLNGMFENALVFNQDISNWNTSSVTDMGSLFSNAKVFNQDIGNWNTSAATGMDRMFWGATAFNQDIGNWNTSAVTTMTYMFSYATAFNQDIGNWNTSAVINMVNMFSSASAFNQDIGDWNTSAVISMAYMFADTSAFNQYIGNWNTSAVTNMTNMFTNASGFNQDIGNWILYPTVKLTYVLDNSGMDCDNYSATLVGWEANNPTVSNRSLGASNIIYGTSAVAARTILVNIRGWTINDSTNGDICDASLSTLDYDMESQVVIYPNPAKEYLTVHYEANQKHDITIYTSLGRLLATYEKAENNFQVPVAHLTNGLYFIAFHDESGKTATLKFVKNN